MMKCVYELPIKKNEHISSLDERSGRIEAYEVRDVNLNRYVFLPTGYLPSTRYVFQEILAEVQCQIDLPAWRIRVWPKASSDSYVTPARGRLNRYKRLQEGWHLEELDQCTAAFKIGAADALFEEKKPFQSPKEGSDIVLLGKHLSSTHFSSDSVGPSLNRFAKFSRFIAGLCFIKWLANEMFSVAYIQYDDLGRANLVLVTPTRLDLESLTKKISDPLNCLSIDAWEEEKKWRRGD